MDRRSILKHTGLAGVLAAGIAPAVHAQAAIRWRLTSSFPKALDTIHGAADVFAKKVGEMTGGKFQVTVHAPGELVPAFGVVDAVQAGTVEAGHTAPYYYFGKDDTFAMGTAIPFGLNSRQLTSWYYEGNGLKLFREFYNQYNIVNFPGGNTGAQMGGWFRKEVKTVADLKGLKFRVGGFAGKVVERIGGVPQNIPGGEIYQALERKTIDATEFSQPAIDKMLGLDQIIKNYIMPGWHQTLTTSHLLVNQDVWDKLEPQSRALIEMGCESATLKGFAESEWAQPFALAAYQQEGVKPQVLPAPVLQELQKVTNEVLDEMAGQDPMFKRVLTSQRTFMTQHNWLWYWEWSTHHRDVCMADTCCYQTHPNFKLTWRF